VSQGGNSVQVLGRDGRSWTVVLDRKRNRLRDSKNEPFFWAHVIFTILITGLLIWLFRRTWHGVWMVLIPAGIFVWFLGFASSNIRPIVRADTPGPPPEHRMWAITKRRQRKRATQDLVKAIEQGRLTAEPPGTRLEEI